MRGRSRWFWVSCARTRCSGCSFVWASGRASNSSSEPCHLACLLQQPAAQHLTSPGITVKPVLDDGSSLQRVLVGLICPCVISEGSSQFFQLPGRIVWGPAWSRLAHWAACMARSRSPDVALSPAWWWTVAPSAGHRGAVMCLLLLEVLLATGVPAKRRQRSFPTSPGHCARFRKPSAEKGCLGVDQAGQEQHCCLRGARKRSLNGELHTSAWSFCSCAGWHG